MPLKGQELHFADQIDGLLERVDRIERFLGGRWRIWDATSLRANCSHLYVQDFGTPYARCTHCGAAVGKTSAKGE